jgi:CRISPR-associated endoribonuclease Cas6
MASFSLYAMRLNFLAERPLTVPWGTAANLVRGQFGKILRREHPDAYTRLFAPTQSEGPSGFHNPPRPFVLRVAELEGARISAGERFTIGVNLFDTREPQGELFENVMERVGSEAFGGSLGDVLAERLDLSLDPVLHDVPKLRVKFVTPTELKGASEPDFAVLFARIRDRLSSLRALYGDGPLDVDFSAIGERAGSIRMSRCELTWHDATRRSRTTRQVHPISGFTGVAQYEGDLREFLPYLKAARWTGVGRQTVWGKGEIHCEEI